MVLKLFLDTVNGLPQFENDVEMYGAQTKRQTQSLQWLFENDVEMYGAQT